MKFGTGIILILTLLACLFMGTSNALGQTVCPPYDVVAAQLQRQYGEAVQVQGLNHDGRFLEIWSNPETGTWTAVMISPDGTACTKAAGDHMQIAKPGNPT